MDDELSPMDSGRVIEAVREPGSAVHQEIVATSPQEAVGIERAGEAGECVTVLRPNDGRDETFG